VLNSTTISLDALGRTSARIVDLDRDPELRPLFETFAASMSGYQVGHFRLRDRSRAVLLLKSRRKRLVLQEQNGREILLRLIRPQSLLDGLARLPHTAIADEHTIIAKRTPGSPDARAVDACMAAPRTDQ